MAYNAPDQVSGSVKALRSKLMSDAAAQTRKAFLEGMVGRTESVLFEQPTKDGFWSGYTKNYTPVKAKSDRILSGEIIEVKIISTDGESCEGVFSSSVEC